MAVRTSGHTNRNGCLGGVSMPLEGEVAVVAMLEERGTSTVVAVAVAGL